jgi:putative salt-induced outer membrane protein YdiY
MARAHVACVVLAGEYMRFRVARVVTREGTIRSKIVIAKRRRHHLLRAVVVIALAVGAGASLQAQEPVTMPGTPLPVPSPPPPPPPSPPPPAPAWSASIGLGFALTSGNADTSTVNLSFDVSSRPKVPNVFKADLLYLRGEENGELSLNRLSIRARDEYTRPGGRGYVFGQLEGLRDTFKDIDYLAAPAVGLGHKVRDTPALSLFLDAGLGLKVEKNMRRAVRTSGAVTASERFTRHLSEHASITQSLSALWTIDRFDDALYTFKAGLTADLTRRSQIKVEVVDLYKTRPPAVTVEKNDVSLVTSVVYKF